MGPTEAKPGIFAGAKIPGCLLRALPPSPHIDSEDMYLNRTLVVQGASASLYTKAETGQLFLALTINDFAVQICGNVSEQEIIEVAENLKVN